MMSDHDEEDPVGSDENRNGEADDVLVVKTPPADRTKAIVVASIAGGVILLLLLAWLVWRRIETPAESDEDKKADVVVSVKVAKAERGPIALESSATGTVNPVRESTVAASISAQITSMGLLKNVFVNKGDLIASLASQDLIAQKNEAAANLEEAKLGLQTLQKVTVPQSSAQSEKDISDAKAAADNTRATYERRQVLYREGGISLKDLEASQLAYTNAESAYRLALKNAQIATTGVNPNARSIAEAKIAQAQHRLDQITVQASRGEVRAPISGIVTDQFHFQGDFASEGEKLVNIADTSSVIIKANFADTVVSDLRVGDLVTVYPPGQDETMSGKVSLISRSSDPTNRSVEVWANFDNGRGLLRPGDSVKFVIAAKPTNDAVIVPASAVTLEASNSDEGTVMVVDPTNVAHEVKVKVGIRQGDKLQITEGLSGGETVITQGNFQLPDGTRVEIQEPGSDDSDKKADTDDKE